MAISPDFPELTISIRLGGGRNVPEYRDEDIQDPPRVISYMIEAVPDAIFSIHAHAGRETNFDGSSIALYFYVDGKYVDGALIDAASLRQGEEAGTSSKGRYVRNNMIRRYQFASRERQIELVESVSTSLSSRPRASKRSTDTPSVSYADYQSPGIDPVALEDQKRRGLASSDDREAYYSVDLLSQARAFRSAAIPQADQAMSGASAGPTPMCKVTAANGDSASTSSPAVKSPLPPISKKNADSASTGSDFTAPEELGTIKIVACHVNKKQPVAFGRNASTTAQIGDAAQEAAKDRSGGLLVRFMAPQAVSPITTWDVDAAANDEGDSSVTYLYHYRTREMLDALGVLPKEIKEERVRPPSPARAPFDTAIRPKRRFSETKQQEIDAREDVKPQEKHPSKANDTTKEEESNKEDWEIVVDEKFGA